MHAPTVSGMTEWMLSPHRVLRYSADTISEYRARRRTDHDIARPARARSTYRRLVA